MAKKRFLELSNMPSPNGLTARTMRRLIKKGKLKSRTTIYSPDAKSRIPTSIAQNLEYILNE